jgi:hypothetical protein
VKHDTAWELAWGLTPLESSGGILYLRLAYLTFERVLECKGEESLPTVVDIPFLTDMMKTGEA